MKPFLAIVLALASTSGLGAEAVVTNAADLARIVYREQKTDEAFDVSGILFASKSEHASSTSCLCLLDGTDGVLLVYGNASRIPLNAGDRIRAMGRTARSDFGQVVARCESLEIIGHGQLPEPEAVSIDELRSGRFDCHYVKVRGTLRDAFDDEVDGRFTYLALNCEGKLLYVSTRRFKAAANIIGAEVEVSGICDPRSIGGRRYMGRLLRADGTEALKILKASDEDAFAVPEIDESRNIGPMEIQSLGRRRAHGTVLAVWRPNNIMISTARGRPIFATIANQPLPAYGMSVDVSGLPETDLFSLSLSCAAWRKSKAPPIPLPQPENASFDDLLGTREEGRRLRPVCNGTTICVRGDVVGMESVDGHAAELTISKDGRLLTIDTSVVPSAANDVAVGCKVEVSGVCVLETDNWRPNALFPPANRYRIVVRTPGELRILASPPWWTPGRLLIVIGILAAALAALILRLALKRRFHAIIAKKVIDARVGERTRLAVELHDSIAQNLTGVAMEIRSAKRAKTADPPGMDRHLDLAAATLDSCRAELRNCIWDLRSLTLDEATIDEAIRRTLQQHLAGARLEVRFNAPRQLFPDSMLHAILRIVRELTINAVRHGHADDIKVAGCIDGGRLLFSVRDNGCGFNPDRAPGMSEGHFGLQGIRERIETLEGTIEIESAAGRGTKCSLSIPMSPDDH